MSRASGGRTVHTVRIGSFTANAVEDGAEVSPRVELVLRRLHARTLENRSPASQPAGNYLLFQNVPGCAKRSQPLRTPPPAARKNTPASSRESASLVIPSLRMRAGMPCLSVHGPQRLRTSTSPNSPWNSSMIADGQSFSIRGRGPLRTITSVLPATGSDFPSRPFQVPRAIAKVATARIVVVHAAVETVDIRLRGRGHETLALDSPILPYAPP